MSSFMETRYKLKTNPFESRVELLSPMANREDERKIWMRVINQRVGQKSNSLNFIVGDYGKGKSFTLYKIFKDAQNENAVMAAYMKFLPEDTVRKFGLEFVQRIFSALDSYYEIKEILKDVKKKDLTELKAVFNDPAIIFSRIREEDIDALNFLTGNIVFSRNELKELGLRRNLNNTETAKEYLLSFLFLLKQGGKNTLVLSIDEVEYVFSQMRGAKIALVFNTLRDVFDLPQSPKALELGDVSNVIFFFGISNDGWMKISDLQKRERTQGGPINPFMRRREEVIFLQDLSKKESRELIELRLRYNRTSKKLEKDPLIPFTKDFVDYIYEITKGDPGTIVERCDYVLVDGLAEKVEVLTVEFAKKVLKNRGLEEEMEVKKASAKK